MTAPGQRDADGYRRTPVGGPTIRADIVDVSIFRIGPAPPGPDRVMFLQLLRAKEPLADTWHPIMGRCEPGESAVACAVRELREEVGLDAKSALGFWALEQVHPYFVAAIDAVVLSPRFAALVDPSWSPRLNAEHREARWVRASDVDRRFLWPGQRAACREILTTLVDPDSPSREALRVRID